MQLIHCSDYCFSMKIRRLQAMEIQISAWLLPVMAIFMLSAVETCNGDQATAIYVFGDSSVDTGNIYLPPNRSTLSPWNNPYGISWPGQPYGRFSSGRLQTDYIAQMLGLPSPVPYMLLNYSKRNETVSKGINFAVSGSGVFDSYGFSKLSTQVGLAKEIITSHKYDSHHLKHSVVLLSVIGNDYAAANLTKVVPKKFVKSLIREMELQMRELYKLGFRKFLVSNVMPFDCLPAHILTGSVCLNTTMATVYTHNKYLSEAISELRNLEDANFVILDLFTALAHIISNPTAQGIHKIDGSCCNSPISPLNYVGCAVYDDKGRALYHLCKHPERALFFDWYHLSQRGWEVITNLYYSHYGFVQDGSSSSSPTSLEKWLHSHNVTLDSIPPKFKLDH